MCYQDYCDNYMLWNNKFIPTQEGKDKIRREVEYR